MLLLNVEWKYIQIILHMLHMYQLAEFDFHKFMHVHVENCVHLQNSDIKNKTNLLLTVTVLSPHASLFHADH